MVKEICIKPWRQCCGGCFGKAHFIISKVFPNIATMQADTSVCNGEFVIIQSNTEDEDNAKLFVKTEDGYSFVVDLSGFRGPEGPEGPKADLTEVGIASIQLFIASMTSPDVPTTLMVDHYKTLTYNRITQWGTMHLDVRPLKTIAKGVLIGRLPVNAPKPSTLIEVNAIGSGGTVGQVYITTDGEIKANDLAQGQRYVVDLTGYYVYGG